MGQRVEPRTREKLLLNLNAVPESRAHCIVDEHEQAHDKSRSLTSTSPSTNSDRSDRGPLVRVPELARAMATTPGASCVGQTRKTSAMRVKQTCVTCNGNKRKRRRRRMQTCGELAS